MLYYLFSAPDSVLRSLAFRIAGGAATGFLIAIALVPLIARYGRRRRFVDREGKSDSARLNELHAKKKDTPVLGGLAILTAAIASTLLWARPLNFHVALVVFALVALGGLGLVDDWVKTFGLDKARGLTPRQKLFGQVGTGLVLGSAIVLFYGGFEGVGLPRAFASELAKAEAKDDACQAAAARITHDVEAHAPRTDRCTIRTTRPSLAEGTTVYPPCTQLAIPLGAVLFVLFVALVVTGSSNAVNLTDGLDGLAGGCLVLAWLVYAALAYVTGRADWCASLSLPHVPGAGELAVTCAALAGGTLGFLWFNTHPAELFMGDAGSLPLGGALGLVAVLVKHELLLPLIGGVFVAEALSVIVQVAVFKATGRRVLACAPLHHHFEFRGWHETKVVARFQMVAGLLALIALATLKVR